MSSAVSNQEYVISKQELGTQNSQLKTINIAVAGNPNSGKSTLINAIAGTRLHVGNWPGVTVEKKEALFEFEGLRPNRQRDRGRDNG